MKSNTITGRNYQVGEPEKLTYLANEYGVKLDQRNLDTYSNAGLEGWWGENGSHKPLQEMNPVRGGFVIDVLKKFDISSSQKIVEIGCGGGIFSEYIASHGYNILGVDISEKSINVAQEHARMNNVQIDYQVASVYELPFENESFDVVMSSDFLEHLEDLVKAISEMSRILKKGGLFIFDTISRNESCVKTFMKLEAEGIIPAGTHEPLLFVQPEELESLANNCGIDFAKDANNPYGFLLQSIIFIDGKFQLGKVQEKETLPHYIGYGVKR